MQKQPRDHVEATKSCVVLKRAHVGDAEGQRIDTMPPEADAGQARVTLG